ncbi:hypothetical protein IAU60_001592 [Kwoniella sp. DSM 27419]
MSSNRPDPRATARAAVLAAAEARLRPPPTYDSVSKDPSSDPAPLSPPATPTSPSSPSASVEPVSLIAQARAAHLARMGVTFPAPPTPWQQSDKEDRELRLKFGRLLDRGIIRDNGYKQSADAVETLLKIATNIQSSHDPKFRTLKATNTLLKNKVLAARGGHEYLIALGFRTQTIEFSQHYVFTASLKKVHELELGIEALQSHLKAVQDRVEMANQSKVYGSAEEAARKAAALAEYEADREQVKVRVERERIARAAREQMEREEKARLEAEQAEQTATEAAQEASEMRDAVTREGYESGEESESELPSYADDRESRQWGGPGRRLGADA